MTIDIWIPAAIISGVAAPLLFRKRRVLAIATAVVVPPVLLCLYAVGRGLAPSAIALAAVSVSWCIAAGLAALCTMLWLRLKHKPVQRPE